MANYFVTGVAGFIAARVSLMLLEAGHLVVGLDNLNDAYDVRMKEYRLGTLQAYDRFQFHKVDIADRSLLDDLKFGSLKFDAIINLAARAGVRASVLNPWAYIDTNITGTLNLLEFCKRNNIPKFILASTSSIYGADAPLPTPETADSDRVLQAYAASKKGAEVLCHSYHYLYDIDVTVVRFFTVYGPAGRPDMSVFRFIRWIVEGKPIQLFGDGTQSRGFTYIDDIARGVINALKQVGFEIINLGGHEDVTMNELITMIQKQVGRDAIIEYLPAARADMKANLADVSKAGKLLGWEPCIGLEEGISRSIDWYLVHRDWASQLDLNL
ncbi:nucleotide sugar epimerase [bacterium SM23_57]|jgi:UDP-glucuronate 4-epimerase|nr:MAG: nucleotide sugar epimerase [bacterium SM23_57]